MVPRKNYRVLLDGGCSSVAEHATVARRTRVRFSPSALLQSKRRLAKFDRILAFSLFGEKMVKIKLRKWNMLDFFRYLKLTLDRSYSKEFSSNFFGYLFFQGIKNIFIKRDYKFAILADGKFAGSVALYYKDGDYELGYFILGKFRNKGIATKASKEIMRLAFNKLKLKKVISTTDFDNKISQKILRKLGFKKIKEKNKEFFWEKRR